MRKTRTLSQELKLKFLSKQNPEFRASLLSVTLISIFFSVFWGDFSHSLCPAGQIPISRDMRAPGSGSQVLANTSQSLKHFISLAFYLFIVYWFHPACAVP